MARRLMSPMWLEEMETDDDDDDDDDDDHQACCRGCKYGG